MSQKRTEIAGVPRHAMARGADRRRIFVDADDYARYLGLLEEAVARFRWRLLAYCLMPNHVHLLIELTEPNLGGGMQWLQGLYSRYFNKRHDRIGHLYEAPYRAPRSSHSLVVADEVPDWLAHDYLLEKVEAITGLACYDDIVATHERSLLTRFAKGAR